MTWTQLASEWERQVVTIVVLTLALIALAHFGLTRWVRRAARQDAAAGGASPGSARVRAWLMRGLQATTPPIAFLLWVHGGLFVFRLLLPRLGLPALVEPSFVVLAWAYRLCVVGGIVWLLFRVGGIIEVFLVSLAARTSRSWDDLLLPLTGKAIRRGLPLLALILSRPIFSLSPVLADVVADATSLLLVALVSFMLYEIVDCSASFLLRQHRIDLDDNLQARSIYTQITVLRKMAVAIIGIFTLASMLMVFDSVRQFGASILASAGLAGIVVGLAAQKSIAMLLAGFQIALTQPIRLDDVVIVENEFGRIEDITLTYAVVRLWDLRRLVVPINYFIEQPFQNWTRASADILGTVFLHVDYTMPLDALRAELTRILSASRHWDGKVNVLQVTDAKEHTLEIRALASAADASRAWDLRCEIREQLIAFVQQRYADSLPRFRTSFEAMPLDLEAAASARAAG